MNRFGFRLKSAIVRVCVRFLFWVIPLRFIEFRAVAWNAIIGSASGIHVFYFPLNKPRVFLFVKEKSFQHQTHTHRKKPEETEKNIDKSCHL